MRALLCVCLLSAIAAPARADDDTAEKAQARLLLSQGNTLFEKGDLRGALVAFRAAYSVYPSPKLLVNAAAAERELGDLPGAANDLRRFLDEANDPDDPFLADRARTDLKALERRTGRIVFAGWPARSVFEVDGKPARDVFYVKPGEHRAKGRTPAGAELETDVSVGTGEAADVPASAAITMVPRGSSGAGPVVVKKKSKWWIGLVVASVVAVGAGVGVGLGLGLTQSSTPLRGDLGIYKFSDFK